MIDIKIIGKYKKLFYRILYAIIGITIISIGLTFVRYSTFGIDPFACLNAGIAKQTGMYFGTWLLITNFILLIVVFIFDRSKIGFGTLYNVVTIGYTSDILLWLIKKITLFKSFSLQIRMFSFVFGLLVLYFGAAVYIEANMGTGPYDAAAIVIAEKIKKQSWFKWIRIGTDALCVFGGVLTQSDVGIGTLLTMLFAGPLIAFFRKIKIFKIIHD